MERQIDQQLDKLKTRIIKMCSLVDEQVEFAIRAVENEDSGLAQLVIERDNKVDKYDLKIDKICQKIFALNQPVAMDLRMIMSSLIINNNLERIGDIAVNIAESFLELKKKPDFMNRIHFEEMSKVVKTMIRNAIDAFIEGNALQAKSVIESDEIVDNFNKENRKILIEIMKESRENIEPGVAMLVISRQLERLGDHATNIAEDVYFIVEAQMIKHKYEKIFTNAINEEEDEKEDII
jgi:phosphate transport system protein